jgi:uncharacterized 2Fe-2S/4Fe-4S cluster protein (DUF4445 family)
MPEITFLPSNKTIVAPPGTGLLDAARMAGASIEAPCGGKGTCGKCIARITSGDFETESLGMLSASSVAEGFVLACKTRIKDTPVTVEIPEQIGKYGGQFIDETEETCLLRRELFPESRPTTPSTFKCILNVPAPQLEDGLSDLDRFDRAIKQQYGEIFIHMPLPLIRRLTETLRAEAGTITVTLEKSSRFTKLVHIIAIEPGIQNQELHGIAVDIGTTTVAVQLVRLDTADVLATRTGYNEQIDCGYDVISRINYARKPERLKELRQRVLNTINSLIDQVCSGHKVEPQNISSAVIAGNTTMIHLLLGLPPEYIRLEPYTPTVLEVPGIIAGELDININPFSWVHISPSVGSYVGGDITSGLLCTELVTDKEELSLFIDIGTNGELVLGNNDFLVTCACSAGPAFEGSGIDNGMRAALGAVEHVGIHPDTAAPTYKTIGDVKPAGICGTGIISLLSELYLTGWMDPAGKLNRQKPSPYIKIDGRQAVYIIANEKESATGKTIFISEKDIENVIRAKAAIYSACALILELMELRFDDLSNIYIAGGFGRHLDLEKAIIIGLIPDVAREKFKYVGNSSLMGAYMALCSKEYRRLQSEQAQRMTYLELNTAPDYMDQYTGALFIPHTDNSRFPTVLEKKY